MKSKDFSRLGTPAIYIAKCGTLCKIGVSENVPVRIKQLERIEKKKVRLIYAECFIFCYATENKIHKMLSKRRVRGEWFRMTVSEALFVAKKLNICRIYEISTYRW